MLEFSQLFQVGEHSIEIIMKDEQLNVTPNFYTYDSSKIKVGSSTCLETEDYNTFTTLGWHIATRLPGPTCRVWQ